MANVVWGEKNKTRPVSYREVWFNNKKKISEGDFISCLGIIDGEALRIGRVLSLYGKKKNKIAKV